MADFKIIGKISTSLELVNFKNKKLLSFFITHKEEYDFLCYADSPIKEKIIQDDLKVGDIIEVSGDMISERILSEIKVNNQVKKVARVKLIPLITEYNIINRNLGEVVINNDYLFRLLALENLKKIDI